MMPKEIKKKKRKKERKIQNDNVKERKKERKKIKPMKGGMKEWVTEIMKNERMFQNDDA